MQRTGVSDELLYADDLRMGTRYGLGTYRVTHEAIIDFASRWDPLPQHIDREAARSGQFGEIIASGLHTLAICQSLAALAVYGTWHVLAGRRMTEIVFHRPVRPDQALTGNVTIRAITSDGPSRSLVTTSTVLNLVDGPRVMSLEIDAYVLRRPR
jgi:acyl dehydratase